MRRERRQRVLRLQDAGRATNRGVYLLPNLLTSAGLFCGVFSISQTLSGFYFTAALAIIAAQLFDGLDGRIARITNTTSQFGVEYDSLCDLVSFGVAPSLLIYRWALMPWGAWGWLATAVFVCCAALRLARFNTMVGIVDGGYFVGLPVPVASAFLAGLVLLYNYLGHSGLPAKHIAVLLATYGLAGLMVSNVRYPSFKQLNLHKRQPLWTLITAIVFLQILIAYYEVVIFGGALVYVAAGPAMWTLRRRRGASDAGDADADPSAGDDSGESLAND